MLRNYGSLCRLPGLCKSLNEIKPKYAMLTKADPDEVQSVNSSSTSPEDDGLERKLKILQLEASVLRQEGRRVPDPDFMKQEHWDNLVQLPSRSARSKYYAFLFSTEKKKEREQEKKLLKKEYSEVRKAQRQEEIANTEHIVYSLSRTAFLLRIYDTTINLWYNNKLSRAMQFGQKLILDCSYDEHMNKRECAYAAKQLMFCFAENRTHDDPFDLYLCNANMNGPTMTYFRKYIPTMLEPQFPLNVHAGSYLDLFPRDQLVYLTPHCKNDMTTYDPDLIYIIGTMVDTMNNEPLSLAKAKKQGLKMARLPLDHYLQWGAGSGKSLTLNQVTNILLDIKMTGDWNKSLAHVPRRKIVDEIREAAQFRERKMWTKSLDKFKTGIKEIDDRIGIDEATSTVPRDPTNKFRKVNYQPKRVIQSSEERFKKFI